VVSEIMWPLSRDNIHTDFVEIAMKEEST
jgi:hypothetical protein